MKIEEFKTPVKNCARCGTDHEEVLFKPFAMFNEHYSLWGMCPVSNEPILMRIVDDEVDVEEEENGN